MEDIRSLEDLLDLQVIDSDLDRLFERRASLPELEAYRTADQELSGIEHQLSEMAERLREIYLASDTSDAEVEMLRRRISGREDQSLALMEEEEQLDAARAEREKERDAVAAEKDRIEEVVAASWKQIDQEVARLEARKKDVVPLIDPDLIELYEQIRSSAEGVGIARLGEGVCGGCHLTLSAAEQIQAAKTFPPRCIHCRRILAPQ